MTYVLLPDTKPWPSRLITWSLAAKNYGNERDRYGVARPFTKFWRPEDYRYARALIVPAFAQWSAVCGLIFEEVADGPGVGIRFGYTYIDGPSKTGAWCALALDSQTRISQALIQIDETDWGSFNWSTAGPEYYRAVGGLMVHELGHALGLDHNTAASVMGMGGQGYGVPTEIDRAGAQFLYGAPVASSVTTSMGIVLGCQNDLLNITGNAGATVDVGAGHDQVGGGAGPDLVTLGDGNDFAGAGDGNDTIDGGSGFDQINTGPGDDMARGGSESDQIAGGPGADTLDGGPGADWIAGGPGPDTFTIRKGESDRDWIADFEPGVDKLNIEGGPVQLIKNGNGTYTLRWDDGHEELLVAGNLSA